MDIVGHILAHYHYRIDYVMDELTLSQVFTLFNGMAAYLKLTNGSDDTDVKSKSDYENNEMPQVGLTMDRLKHRDGIGVHGRKTEIENVPTDILDLIAKE